MSNWSTWRHMVEDSKREALEAVDHYNRPLADRGLEGYFVHMHIAWLYLLHAEFKRQGLDYRYRTPGGRIERIDGGEPRTWELAKCVRERFADNDPVRKNLELSILLRNQIEHRYARALTLVTAGKAHALLVNYETELVTAFGPQHSLAESLRFPVFVASMTAQPGEYLRALNSLPVRTRNLLAQFEAGLDPTIASDQRYDFRVLLIPKLGPKAAPDMAIEFVRETDLTEEQKAALTNLDKGKVIVREQVRPVVNLDNLRPSAAAAKIEERLPFHFNTYYHFHVMWKHLRVRPPTHDAHPERTDERYCIYDSAHRDYVYTLAYVDKVAREIGTVAKFKAVFGREPIMKISPLQPVDSPAAS